MEISSHEQKGVIIRRFSGDVRIEDIIVSWNNLFAAYPNLKDHKGIATVFLDARFKHESENLSILLEYFRGYVDYLKDVKIAFVIDNPMVTSVIILAQRLKLLQFKPFATEKAAMEWLLI